MTRLSSFTPLALLAALALAACGGKNAPDTGPMVGDEGLEARVAVTNNNWLDMNIYAERGTLRVRLGTVTSMGKETLVIPRNVMASATSIQLIASPIGSNAVYTTYPIDIWPGDTVEFNIENNMGISNVSTWSGGNRQ